MNREIKFRVWRGDYFSLIGFTNKDYYPCRFHLDDPDIAPNLITQFTGFYDRNGEEIYEGDIVSFIHNSGFDLSEAFGNKEQEVVEYKNGQFWPRPFVWNDYEDKIHELKDFEIIGNIYQSPEILGVVL